MPGSTDHILERLTALHPQKIDLSLNRIHRLLEALGHPERQLPPVIHVAGTNGKGSVVATLAGIAEAAGLKAHVYTSPHLVRFNERICPAGTTIDNDSLNEVLEDCEKANDGAPITFFEITTAAAFLAFSRVRADLTLLETGLGGRLDATNVLPRPAVTVITPVSLDHQGFLGPTIAAIAGEKAGILKPGVPAVIGPQRTAALEVIARRAAAVGAPLFCWGKDYHARLGRGGGRFHYREGSTRLAFPLPALPGHHQIANAAIAIRAARILDPILPRSPGDRENRDQGNRDQRNGPWRMTAETLATGLARARWPARLQRLPVVPLTARLIDRGFTLWLDGGHNPSAGRALARHFATLPGPLTLIVGMLGSKDVRGFLRPFLGRADRVWGIGMKEGHDSRSAVSLAEAARKLGFRADSAATVQAALAQIDGPPGQVLITGSLYLAGEVLECLGTGNQSGADPQA